MNPTHNANTCPCGRRQALSFLVCNQCWQAWPLPKRRRWQMHCSNASQKALVRELLAFAASRSQQAA